MRYREHYHEVRLRVTELPADVIGRLGEGTPVTEVTGPAPHAPLSTAPPTVSAATRFA
ncbi:hypothetical protein GCM10010339_03800 [Streptomyces alanosinicus]|uniref:Uncharacterized protein n=1 Tax=Streptomyces alanosinicus TaxID=68171 RepID=A0A918YBL6_9ACTN|nr:hypothetical protein GCM10010339_03800 [Streptomyces alanosinicus]